MPCFRRPWNFLAALFLLILGCFAVIKWYRFHERQQRLCTSSVLCRLHDIAPKEKAPAVSVEALRPLFGQPLFFLGEGKQCVAYETADGRYVLKLFKKASKKKKSKQLEEYVTGGIIARAVLPEETGVIACVCGPQTFKLPIVTVLNERGRIEKIALQDVPFIFQRKAQPFKQTLMRLLAERKGKEAALRLESLFTLLMTCREKGVLDRDGSLIRNGNIGFVDGKAVLLDTGKLCRLTDRKRLTLHDLNRLKPLESWLESSCPELLPIFKTCLERYRATMTNTSAKKT
jgi:hypothetical protein